MCLFHLTIIKTRFVFLAILLKHLSELGEMIKMISIIPIIHLYIYIDFALKSFVFLERELKSKKFCHFGVGGVTQATFTSTKMADNHLDKGQNAMKTT